MDILLCVSMSEDSSCIAQPMSPSGLAGPSGGSHIDGTLWEERRDHEAVTSKSNQETDHRRRVTRRSRDRSEERVEREMQDIVNEAALRPWTSVVWTAVVVECVVYVVCFA